MSQAVQMRTLFLQDLAKRRNELYTLLSQYDNQEQDLLHFVENEKYDAVVMVKIAKQLKDNRIARRTIKIELEQIQSMRDTLSQKNYKKFEEKTYEYKTDVLSNITHRTKGVKVCNKNYNTK